VTLLSYGDTACIGLASDVAAVDRPDLLRACAEAAFDEVRLLSHAEAAHR
jgi:hypothetical protein